MSIKKAKKSHDKQREKDKRHERKTHTQIHATANTACHPVIRFRISHAIPKYGKRINEKHATRERKKKIPDPLKRKMPALQNKTSKDPWQIAPPGIKKRENHESKGRKREKNSMHADYPRLQDIVALTLPVS